MKNAIILFTVFLSLAFAASGQSYHFSQFFSTPLLSNPAHTGNIDGPYRFASNFRAQGLAGGNPYITGYVSADISPFRDKLLTGHKAGVGLYVMNDQSLNGALKSNTIGLSGAYTVGLDEAGIHSLGLGVQGTFHQRRVDISNLSFESQFGANGYNAALPVGEDIPNLRRSNLDLNTGLLYQLNSETFSVFSGVSVYNLLRRNETVFGVESQIPTRIIAQVGGNAMAGEAGTVYGSFTYNQQGGAREITFGGAYGYQVTEGDRNEITFGAWYRLNDAIIPYLGYYRNGFQFGFTYDYTVSDLKTGAQVRNGYELTLIFSAPDKTELKRAIPWY